MRMVKVTEKGQVTIPMELRRRLGIRKNDYVAFEDGGDHVKLRKVRVAKPLGPEDPIWGMVGLGSSGRRDVSDRHDHYLAEGERKRWRKS